MGMGMGIHIVMTDMDDVIYESWITEQIKGRQAREWRHESGRTDEEKGAGIINDDRVCCKNTDF